MIYSRLRKFFFAAGLLIISLLVGVTGFSLIEDYKFLDSVYMTLITMSTVGFQEVHPLGDGGKIFVVFYIMFNIGVLAYVVSIVTTYVFEGELNKIYKHIMFDWQVKKIKNHVIVCGYGRNGSRACRELQKMKTPVIVIEKSEDSLETTGDDLPAIHGDATLDENLIKAGIERARALITSLPHDADNVFITMSAKEHNPDIMVIARASDFKSEQKLHRAGADRVVMPDILGGIHMASLITKPYVIEFLEILNGVGDSDLRLEEFSFSQLKPDYQNRSIRELDIRKTTGATVVGIKDDARGFLFGPNVDTVIGSDDILIVLGSDASLDKFKHYCV